MPSYGGVKEGGTTERDSCASSLWGRGLLFKAVEDSRMNQRSQVLTWHDVLKYHKTQAGIHAPVSGDASTPRSVLMNTADDAVYPDEHQGYDIFYIGEGQEGDQEPIRGNRGLIVAQECGFEIRIFEKLKKNQWSDRGLYKVIGHEFVSSSNGRRKLMRFRLRPAEENT